MEMIIYVSSGTIDAMSWKAYEIKTQKLGLARGYKVEGKVLNRLIRRTEEGWEIDADPTHAELVVEQLGLKDDKGIGTPELSGAVEDDKDDDVPLAGADITSYRGVIARCNCIGSDRPDFSFAIKEGCREMSSPTTGSLRRLMNRGDISDRIPDWCGDTRCKTRNRR